MRRIFEETEGNPFFLSEVVNLLTQEGTLMKESVSDIAVPDGVREALGRRLDRISEEANELLQVCAVAGREFAYDTLTLLDERSEDRILRLIEEAIESRVIEEMDQPGRYRFTHALMQETLLAELTTTRRVRLHGQVGEALEERWGTRADERATRLAGHFGEASLLSPRFAAKAVRYAMLAAGQAEAQTAWDEAANWYERALAIVTASDNGVDLGEDEAELLVALGICQRKAVNNRGAWRNLMRAITLFRERGDGSGLARALVEAAWILSASSRRLAFINEALSLIAGSDPHLEARLLLLRLQLIGRDTDGYRADQTRIEEIVAEHGFPDIGALLLQVRSFEATAKLDFGAALDLSTSARDRLLSLAMPIEASSAMMTISIGSFLSGDVERALAIAREQAALCRRFHAGLARLNIELRLSGVALARGDWAGFEAFQATWAGGAGGYGFDLHAAARAELVGDLERAVALLPAPAMSGGFPGFVAHLHAGRARVRLLAGDENGARAELAQFAVGLADVPATGFNFGRFFALTELGEALPTLADDALARDAYDELVRCAAVRWDPMCTRGADPIRGGLALRLGLIEEAEAHFTTGLQWSETNGLFVEQARNLEGLAQVALARSDAPGAMALLDRAAACINSRGPGSTSAG